MVKAISEPKPKINWMPDQVEHDGRVEQRSSAPSARHPRAGGDPVVMDYL